MHDKISDHLFFQHSPSCLQWLSESKSFNLALSLILCSGLFLTDKWCAAFVISIMMSYLRYTHFLSDIHLVICDMDGLLLDTERLSEDSFRQASTLFDLDFDTELFSALTGLSAPAHRKVLSTHLPDEVDVVAFERQWKQIYFDSLSEDVPVKPMAADFLKNIRQGAVPVAVATSSHTCLLYTSDAADDC